MHFESIAKTQKRLKGKWSKYVLEVPCVELDNVL